MREPGFRRSKAKQAGLPNLYEKDKEDDTEPTRERCNEGRRGTTKR